MRYLTLRVAGGPEFAKIIFCKPLDDLPHSMFNGNVYAYCCATSWPFSHLFDIGFSKGLIHITIFDPWVQ